MEYMMWLVCRYNFSIKFNFGVIENLLIEYKICLEWNNFGLFRCLINFSNGEILKKC